MSLLQYNVYKVKLVSNKVETWSHRTAVNMRLILLSAILFLIGGVKAQRRVVGDISESRISQVAGEAGEYDYREKNRYRRPATYLILASKIVRPSTIYQVVVSLLQEAEPMRVRAALSRDGVEVYGEISRVKRRLKLD